MVSCANLSREQQAARWFRIASGLAWAHAAIYVVTLILAVVSARLAGSVSINGDFFVEYGYATHFLHYGMQIGMFAFLVAAAKHMQSSNALLKTGGIVGMIGPSLQAIVVMLGIILGAIYRYIGNEIVYTPFPSASSEGWRDILLMIFAKTPIVLSALSWAAPIGLAMCAADVFMHSTKAVRFTAVSLVAVIAAERIVEIIPMTVGYFSMSSLLSVVLDLAVNILAAVLFASLAKYEEQAHEYI